MTASSLPDWDRLRDLKLRDWRPRPCVRLPVHELNRPRVPAIDAHNHLGWRQAGWLVPDVGALVTMMDEVGLLAIVNLDGWPDKLHESLERYDRAYPGRFITFWRPDLRDLQPGWPEGVVRDFRAAVDAGAGGLKIWKDLGLERRDEKGRLLALDDERLSLLWEAAADLDVPVLVHTGDPVAFFQPADERNERIENLIRRPEWWFGDPDRHPSLERLLEAMECVVAAHPRTRFIGAHVGCYAENLEWVGQMLATHPNFFIDLSARMPELGRQPRAARRLVLRFPDRVLFGTDRFPPVDYNYRLHYRFLETDDEQFPYHVNEEVPRMGRWQVSALDLPADVLPLVYRDNARRVIPALRTQG